MKNNLFDKFLDYEVEHKLFEIEYDGIKIWEILRTYVFIEIQQIQNNLQPLFPQNKNKEKRKKSIKNFINGMRFFFIKDIDYIFLNNPRRVMQRDKKYYCIYTDLMIDLLKDKSKCITLEDPFWALNENSLVSHFEPVKTDNIIYLDTVEYLFKFKKFIFKNLKKKKYNELHLVIMEIKEDIEKYFDCDLSKIFMVGEDKILYLILLHKLYLRTIKRMNPKGIFEFYDAFPSKVIVNKAGHELGVPIIEIQHGIVTRENPIFLKYRNVSRKYDCVPDYVLSYGERLLNKEHMPIDKKNIYYIGSLFLDYKKKEYKNKSSKKKNILFVSQSNLGKYLSEYASRLADLLKDYPEYQIIYKMHPYEIGTGYECLNKHNIKVINNRDKDLYYYQSISIAQVGVYSTGLYEGLSFGLKTFIIDNNFGTEEIKEILRNDRMVYYIKDISEIIDVLKKSKNDCKYKDKYFNIVDKRMIKKIIEKITER